jgi:hypothetical protein
MRSHRLVVTAIAIGMASTGADCDGDVVQDPTFRDWCGSALCSWKTDYGEIQRAPTWNANDFGVSFLDGPMGAEISQQTAEGDAQCLLFTSVGDIDPGAQMHLAVDFDNDGTIDVDAPLGTATWRRVQTEITAPANYQGITFYVRKIGKGTAILAEMRVTSSTGCMAPPPALTSLGAGDPCGGPETCASGLVCAEDPDAGKPRCLPCDAETCGDQ